MKKKTKLVIGVFVLAVVLTGCFVYFNNKSSSNLNVNSNNNCDYTDYVSDFSSLNIPTEENYELIGKCSQQQKTLHFIMKNGDFLGINKLICVPECV